MMSDAVDLLARHPDWDANQAMAHASLGPGDSFQRFQAMRAALAAAVGPVNDWCATTPHPKQLKTLRGLV